jgi:prevent-host-death family protein
MSKVRRPDPVMRQVQVSEAKEHLGSLIQEVRSGHVPVQFSRYGKPVAVLVSSEDFEEMRRIQDAWKVAQIRAALDGPTFDLGEVLDELNIA